MIALYAGSGWEVLPITPEIPVRSVRFPASYPKDPQDGIIGATAIAEGLRLLTNDARIAGSGLLAMAG